MKMGIFQNVDSNILNICLCDVEAGDADGDNCYLNMLTNTAKVSVLSVGWRSWGNNVPKIKSALATPGTLTVIIRKN